MSSNSLEWIPAKDSKQILGIALVIHGLNLMPQKMKPTIERLVGSGIEVFNCSLRGHGDNYLHQENLSDDEARLESFKQVTYELWRHETYEAYKHVAARSKQVGGAPVFLIGYSLGGLIGCDLFLAFPEVKFNKMVLFAPALKIRAYSYVLKLLSPFPRVIIPSASPRNYRSNRGTSIAAYHALYSAISNLQQSMSDKLNIPTIVFVDKADEFVSHKGIGQMIKREKLTRWKLYTVQKAENAQKQYHHLIIDAPSLGDNVWENIMQLTITHLGMQGE
jgi:esterase/lipase